MHAHCRKACKVCSDAAAVPASIHEEARRLAALADSVESAGKPEQPERPAAPQSASVDPPSPSSSPPSASPVPSTPPAAAPLEAPPPEPATLSAAETAQKGEVEQRELLRWLSTHHLTEAAHMPILRALGVHRVGGRVGSLAPLQHLSFTELSAELQGVQGLPCAPACAADKAAVWQALQEAPKV